MWITVIFDWIGLTWIWISTTAKFGRSATARQNQDYILNMNGDMYDHHMPSKSAFSEFPPYYPHQGGGLAGGGGAPLPPPPGLSPYSHHTTAGSPAAGSYPMGLGPGGPTCAVTTQSSTLHDSSAAGTGTTPSSISPYGTSPPPSVISSQASSRHPLGYPFGNHPYMHPYHHQGHPSFPLGIPPGHKDHIGEFIKGPRLVSVCLFIC